MRAERETRALPGYAFVDHVGLSVPDLDAAVEFFTVVFGARELSPSTPIPTSSATNGSAASCKKYSQVA